MPPPVDVEELARYKATLEDAVRFGNIVRWKPVPSVWLRENLGNHTQKSIVRLMWDNRDSVKQRIERRPEWKDGYRFYYAFVIPIEGISVFIETVFVVGDTDDESIIRVVNMHPTSD
jgi:hypothetical protein